MELAALALELDSTLPVLYMSPDLPRVLASVVLMLSLVTSGLTAMDLDLMVTELASGLMDMELVASAGEWDFTPQVLFMSPDLLRVLVADIFTRIFVFIAITKSVQFSVWKVSKTYVMMGLLLSLKFQNRKC